MLQKVWQKLLNRFHSFSSPVTPVLWDAWLASTVRGLGLRTCTLAQSARARAATAARARSHCRFIRAGTGAKATRRAFCEKTFLVFSININNSIVCYRTDLHLQQKYDLVTSKCKAWRINLSELEMWHNYTGNGLTSIYSAASHLYCRVCL